MTDAELAALAARYNRWNLSGYSPSTPTSTLTWQQECVAMAGCVPALADEIQRLRTALAAATAEDSSCTGPDRSYFGGAVYDRNGAALADQAILLAEPCDHAHRGDYWQERSL